MVAGLAPVGDRAPIDLVDLVRRQKRIMGAYYGSASPYETFGTIVELYLRGELNCDDLVQRRYPLEQINEGFEALDRGDLDTLCDVCTDAMYESLREDLAARGHVAQHTGIEGLEAALIEVVTEGEHHLASLSFSGTSRDTAEAAPQAFQEIWHLQKPVSGNSGWLLAGIQQVS